MSAEAGVKEAPAPNCVVSAASLYHLKPVPLAVKVGIAEPGHTAAGLDAVGAGLVAVTFTAIKVRALSQPFNL